MKKPFLLSENKWLEPYYNIIPCHPGMIEDYMNCGSEVNVFNNAPKALTAVAVKTTIDTIIHLHGKQDTLKLSNPDNYDFFDIHITKNKFPIAYDAIVKDWIKQGLTQEQVEEQLLIGIEMDIYYEPSHGVMCVQSEISDQESIYSPYTGKKYSE